MRQERLSIFYTKSLIRITEVVPYSSRIFILIFFLRLDMLCEVFCDDKRIFFEFDAEVDKYGGNFMYNHKSSLISFEVENSYLSNSFKRVNFRPPF